MEHKQGIVKWIQLALIVGNALLFVFEQYAYASIALVLVWVAVSELEFVSDVWRYKGKAKFDVKEVKKDAYDIGLAMAVGVMALIWTAGFFTRKRLEKVGVVGGLQEVILVCIGLVVFAGMIAAIVGIVKWIIRLNADYATRYLGKKRVK